MLNKIRNAFTLVELLVVMGVLAVLAAGLIALIDPADRVNQANDSKVIGDLNQMVGGLLSYAANNDGNYPLVTGTASAANFSALQAALTNELKAFPAGVSGYTYSYASTNVAPSAAKVGVSFKSKKFKTDSAGTLFAYAVACWDSSSSATYGGKVGYNRSASAITFTAGTTCL